MLTELTHEKCVFHMTVCDCIMVCFCCYLLCVAPC